MVTESPVEILKQGAAIWNQWRRENNASLSDTRNNACDFIGADLSNMDLSGCDLHGLDLRNASFANTDLTDAILASSDITNADFTDAELGGTDFTDVINDNPTDFMDDIDENPSDNVKPRRLRSTYCSNCGVQFGKDVSYCPVCGSEIEPAEGDSPSPTLPTGVNVITWLMLFSSIIVTGLSLWTLSDDGQKLVHKIYPTLDSTTFTIFTAIGVVLAIVEFILAINIRLFQPWAYRGAMGLFVVHLLNQFIFPLTGASPANSQTAFGIVLPIIYLIVFGSSYQDFKESAQQIRHISAT